MALILRTAAYLLGATLGTAQGLGREVANATILPHSSNNSSQENHQRSGLLLNIIIVSDDEFADECARSLVRSSSQKQNLAPTHNVPGTGANFVVLPLSLNDKGAIDVRCCVWYIVGGRDAAYEFEEFFCLADALVIALDATGISKDPSSPLNFWSSFVRKNAPPLDIGTAIEQNIPKVALALNKASTSMNIGRAHNVAVADAWCRDNGTQLIAMQRDETIDSAAKRALYTVVGKIVGERIKRLTNDESYNGF